MQHGCEARGNTRKEDSKINEINTIWLLKEVHHEKPNQSLSEIIVIQVVLCIIIVPGLMNKEPPKFTTSLRACNHHPTSGHKYFCIHCFNI